MTAALSERGYVHENARSFFPADGFVGKRRNARKPAAPLRGDRSMFNFEHPRDEIRASVAALVVQLTIVTR
jgi:hypothetical protein